MRVWAVAAAEGRGKNNRHAEGSNRSNEIPPHQPLLLLLFYGFPRCAVPRRNYFIVLPSLIYLLHPPTVPIHRHHLHQPLRIQQVEDPSLHVQGPSITTLPTRPHDHTTTRFCFCFFSSPLPSIHFACNPELSTHFIRLNNPVKTPLPHLEKSSSSLLDVHIISHF